MSSVEAANCVSNETAAPIQCGETDRALSELNGEVLTTKPDKICAIDFELPEDEEQLVSECTNQKKRDCSGNEENIQETRDSPDSLTVRSSSFKFTSHAIIETVCVLLCEWCF